MFSFPFPLTFSGITQSNSKNRKEAANRIQTKRRRLQERFFRWTTFLVGLIGVVVIYTILGVLDKLPPSWPKIWRRSSGGKKNITTSKSVNKKEEEDKKKQEKNDELFVYVVVGVIALVVLFVVVLGIRLKRKPQGSSVGSVLELDSDPSSKKIPTKIDNLTMVKYLYPNESPEEETFKRLEIRQELAKDYASFITDTIKEAHKLRDNTDVGDNLALLKYEPLNFTKIREAMAKVMRERTAAAEHIKNRQRRTTQLRKLILLNEMLNNTERFEQIISYLGKRKQTKLSDSDSDSDSDQNKKRNLADGPAFTVQFIEQGLVEKNAKNKMDWSEDFKSFQKKARAEPRRTFMNQNFGHLGPVYFTNPVPKGYNFYELDKYKKDVVDAHTRLMKIYSPAQMKDGKRVFKNLSYNNKIIKKFEKWIEWEQRQRLMHGDKEKVIDTDEGSGFYKSYFKKSPNKFNIGKYKK